MRLADAKVLPFDFVDFADTVQKYTKDLGKLLSDKQEEIRERNQELEEGVFKATLDPRRPTVAPAKEDVPPHPEEDSDAPLTDKIFGVVGVLLRQRRRAD